eukprot:1145167-Pelagomonas_calceolata.AAC.4
MWLPNRQWCDVDVVLDLAGAKPTRASIGTQKQWSSNNKASRDKAGLQQSGQEYQRARTSKSGGGGLDRLIHK